jgi:UDP-N-acetylmuramyl pentapeptide phosphotransferase/UDP-N-acetylglucosamine-1-phosphate transferase
VLCIIILSFFKTPLKHTPVIIVDGFYEDVSLKMILNQQPSLSFCNLVIENFETALSKNCTNCSIKKSVCSLKTKNDIYSVVGTNNLIQFQYGFAEILTDDQNVSNKICGNLIGNSSSTCLSKDQIETLLTKKNEVSNKNHKIYLSNESSKFFETNIFYILFVVSFFMTGVVIVTRKYHIKFTSDYSSGIQKVHDNIVPRIGGVPIFVSIVIVYFILSEYQFTRGLILPIIIGAFPAFFSGLLDDITHSVSASVRLIATMFGALYLWWGSGLLVTNVELPLMDHLLQYSLFSVCFSLICIAGVCHSMNLIDGLNGLSSGFAISALFFISVVSNQIGDTDLNLLCLIFICIILGFFLFNISTGKIFLGDGGAYLLGFILASLAIHLPARNYDVSPWISLIFCSYPIIETIFTIFRRIHKKKSIHEPDNMHLHHLVSTFIDKKVMNKNVNMIISTLLILSYFFVFSVFALNDINNSNYLKKLFIIEVLLFIAIYYSLKCCKKTTDKNYYQI